MRVFTFVLGMLVPAPVLALSCVPYGPIDAAIDAQAAKERYAVVHGQITFEGETPPATGPRDGRFNPPAQTKIAARLEGRSLTNRGFRGAFDEDVTLEINCVSAWCGFVGKGTDVLAFVRYDPTGFTVETHACGSYLFPTPSKQQLRQVYRCLVKDRGCRRSFAGE